MSLILDGTTGIVTINASSSGVGGIASNTALGSQALSATGQVGTGNTAIGGFALGTNVSGIDNTAIGYGAGYYITSNGNTAVGRSALSTASSGSGASNTAVGFYSLQATTSGGSNTALGYQSGYNNTTGQFNVLLGYQAGYRSAGVGTIGDASVFIGYQAGYANQGNNNVGIGNGALTAQTSGTFNVGIGQGSGGAITTGTKNVIIGSYTGNNGGLDIRTSSNNIVLSDGDGNPRQIIDSNGRMSTGVQAGSFGQYGQGYSSWANVSSHTMNIADLFPLLPVGGAGMTIMMQIITQSGMNNATSYYVMAKRNIDQSGWAFSVIASQISGPSISFSGSANSITLSFSFGNQYGKCMLSVLCAT